MQKYQRGKGIKEASVHASLQFPDTFSGATKIPPLTLLGKGWFLLFFNGICSLPERRNAPITVADAVSHSIRQADLEVVETKQEATVPALCFGPLSTVLYFCLGNSLFETNAGLRKREIPSSRDIDWKRRSRPRQGGSLRWSL